MEIKVVNKNPYGLPKYQTEGSAGFDLMANIEKEILLYPGKRILVPTGLFVELPVGYELQVRPRSGLALKHGISVTNTPGTVDSDYRSEVGVILINLSDEIFVINPGDRIAQGVVNQIEQVTFVEVDELSETDRGAGGFGHSGVK